jgi:hypothetical protein
VGSSSAAAAAATRNEVSSYQLSDCAGVQILLLGKGAVKNRSACVALCCLGCVTVGRVVNRRFVGCRLLWVALVTAED